ncbi:MAG: reverse transcriptase domain-containing protein [Candidatus Thiodiazotropha endolucinida]|nr:endonuclease/exonuclease/phosphatase family protein [Candidatus Thiodiazotropha taylori]MCW4347127.1 reverse transcriptase domain-containing protein [Candidatus Thiodiazotropha endolucinida]
MSSNATTVSNNIFNSLHLTHNLSVVHYNVQSILSKLDILHTELYEFDILTFTETWLSPAVATEDLMLQSYNTPERKDREGDSHGGLILYVKEGVHYKRRTDLELRNIECIWIELANVNKHILLGVFYRPPNSNAAYLSSIEDSISMAEDTGIAEIIVTGDFNLNTSNPSSSRKVNSICQQFCLHQTITEPTHFTEHSSSTLDLLFVSNKQNLINSGVGEPFLDQHVRYHCPVYGIFKFSKPRIHTFTRKVWYYDQGNYTSLRNKASQINWDTLQNPDIDVYAQNISNQILSLAQECIPTKKVRIKPTEPPWINCNIKRHIRKRKRAYKKAKRTNLMTDWKTFKTLRNNVVGIIRDSKKEFYDKIASKLLSASLNSKDWWKTLKSFISPSFRTAIPPLEFNNKIYSEELDKANILNNFFQSQCVLNEDGAKLPNILPTAVKTELRSIILTPHEVENILKLLPIGKASGPNDLNNRILRELSSELSYPYCCLFNQSLRTGSVPKFYKDANVCPVPKKGDPSLVSNYRPISLLNSEDKLLEKLIFKYLYNHLRDNQLLSSLQSGFIPGDSTVNQLTYIYNMFCQALDSGKEVRAVFCDISKAFDRVWHAGLLLKLQAAGVTGEILNWFRSYLGDRRQRVVTPGIVSDWTCIHAGVPQGSILGPLLFLLYINDIVEDIDSNIRLFADDTSLFIIVDDPVSAAASLNTDLSTISRWASTWLVSFNPSKTEALLISRKFNKNQHPPIYMQNQQITEVETHKHLGIYLSNDCTWHQHIAYITEKAWARINIMRKLKFKLDRKSLETIYLTFIRPLIEYGDVIWDNCTQYEKYELDKIQHEAARIATGSTKLVSLNALYKEVRWDTLEDRRRNHKLTLFYKMNYNLTPQYLSSLVPQTVSNASRYNLRNSNDLQTINARTNLYYNSFLPSTIRAWNVLPCVDKQSESVNSFKHTLNKNKSSVPIYYYFGKRKTQVLHTRLRTNCSSLNLDLFIKNITDSPMCQCGSIEDAQHYFFHCRNYQRQRTELLNGISEYCTPTLNLLLYGDNTFTIETNIFIIQKVHRYITETKRFC